MIEIKKKKKKNNNNNNKQTNKQNKKKQNKSKELNMVWLDGLCPLQKALGNYIFAYEFFFFFFFFFFFNNESNVKFI